jgi:nitrogen fixation/metabolism regulation signal transduction histidine kinase
VSELPRDGAILLENLRFLIAINLIGTLCIVLPIHLWIGRAATFRISGPLSKIELHLRRVRNGDRPGPCKIRKDDELHELCALLNETLQPLSDPLPRDTTATDAQLDAQASLLGANVPQEIEEQA